MATHLQIGPPIRTISRSIDRPFSMRALQQRARVGVHTIRMNGRQLCHVVLVGATFGFQSTATGVGRNRNGTATQAEEEREELRLATSVEGYTFLGCYETWSGASLEDGVECVTFEGTPEGPLAVEACLAECSSVASRAKQREQVGYSHAALEHGKCVYTCTSLMLLG
jgi:hypothetical protein